jgi:3D (Asp-Asp-Asp) domain-containing protein
MYVPGYGDGVVEDRGSAIKGEKRIDLYFNSHSKAREWGRQTVEVEIKE